MKMTFAFIMIMLLLVAHAEDFVAINSVDGRDVLSGVFYANVKGLPVEFMPSQGGDANIFADKVGPSHDVLLIQGSIPVSSFVEQSLKTKNDTIESYPSSDGGATNLDLAKRSGATSFIVVDSAYSDSAISVMPYAKLSKSYVILANKDNAAQVHDIVKGNTVMIYGLVDKEVLSALADTNPTIIGNGADQFADNIQMVQKTMNDYNVSTVIISDGSFLEDSMATGGEPVLLIGALVPQPTYNFVESEVGSGKLKVTMLIGTTLVQPVYDMRKRIQTDFANEGQNKTFDIIEKFAQAIPAAGSGAMVLDTFYMPAYIPRMNVTDVSYNTQSKKAMVTVSNIGDGSAFYTLEVRVQVNGQDFKVFPTNGTNLIDSGEQQGSEYPLDLSQVPEGNVTATVLVEYGVSNTSLTEFTSYQGPLTSISYVDKSNVTVQSAAYDSKNNLLLISVRNLGSSPAYAFAKVNLTLQGAPATISAPSTLSLDPNGLGVVEIPLQMSDADVSANSNITVSLDYGGRQGFLVRHGDYMIPLQNNAGFPWLLVGVVVLIILVIIAVAVSLMKKAPAPAKKEPPKSTKKK